MKSEVHLKIWLQHLKVTFNDQLVEELYGEIRNFRFTIRNYSYEIPGIGGQRVCFFGTEHAKEEKRRFERVLAFRSVCEQIQNTLQNTRKCGSQRTTSFNAVGKAYQMLEKPVFTY
jgi:hypothetical protein